MNEQNKEITRNNLIRIKDEKVVETLNEMYEKTKNIYQSKNKFFNDIIKLGVQVLQKQEKDNCWKLWFVYRKQGLKQPFEFVHRTREKDTGQQKKPAAPFAMPKPHEHHARRRDKNRQCLDENNHPTTSR